VKRIATALAVLVGVGLLAWLLFDDAPADTPKVAGAAKHAPSPAPSPRDAAPESTEPSMPPQAKEDKRRVSEAERAELRRRILERMRSREHAAPDEPSREAADTDDASPPAAGGIADKTGLGRTGVVKTINEDFSPLAEECYQAATERRPDLRGMLDIEVAVIADEEVGGLVDSVDVGRENELDDAEMLECIRESMLSTYFPSLADNGRTEMRLTMIFAPKAPADAP